MTYKQILQNPNFYVVGKIAMKDISLEMKLFQKSDEEGVEIVGEYNTLDEAVVLGGHKITRFNNDKTMFCHGLCLSIPEALELIALLPSLNLRYVVDVDVLSKLELTDYLNKPEWQNSDNS